jgi:hypothetical protein
MKRRHGWASFYRRGLEMHSPDGEGFGQGSQPVHAKPPTKTLPHEGRRGNVPSLLPIWREDCPTRASVVPEVTGY